MAALARHRNRDCVQSLRSKKHCPAHVNNVPGLFLSGVKPPPTPSFARRGERRNPVVLFPSFKRKEFLCRFANS